MTATLPPAPFRQAFRLPDVAHSDAFGEALATLVVTGFGEPQVAPFDGFTIHFSGDLGTGKTTIVRALLHSLGVAGRIKSPTYTLVEPYVVPMPKSVESRHDVNLYCYHFDFYRFEDPHEWLEAGFRDYFSDAVLRLVEWPERACTDDGSLLPPPDAHVVLDHAGDGRRVVLSSATSRGAAWLGRASFDRLRTSRGDASSDGA